jgi:ABC-2 type transport system permease protein
MIRTIKAEWRKNVRRPALLVGSGAVAGVVALVYAVNFYQATHPSVAARGAASILTLYPDQLVNNLMGAAFPLGAAVALVLGALVAGSDYSWGTFKTMLTQRSGRLTSITGRMVAFQAWMGILTAIIFLVGAACSVAIALGQGHAIAWAPALDFVKGFSTIWLILAVNGSLGMALGVLFKQPAAALGVGLIYGLALQVIIVRFVATINGGAYQWIANLFDGQNSTALTQYFTSPAFGQRAAPEIAAAQAVLVLCAYLAFFIIVTAGIVRQRDVT